MNLKRCLFPFNTGFSFVEVMVAMVILSISLVILMESQTRSMNLISKVRSIDSAVTLASEKMTELTQMAQEKGITSLKDSATGDFNQDKYPGYKWKYRVLKIPTPNFQAMMGMVTGEGEDKDKEEKKNDGATNAALFAGPLQQIGKIWGEALKELHLEVTWNEGSTEKSYELVTHLISPDGINQAQAMIGSLGGGGGPPK
jgi:general secretion pathway protein I